VSDLRAAVGFLTSVPVGREPPGARTVAWFPVVGALVGFAVGGIWWGASEAFPPLVAAVIAVAADAVLTGGLHLDGLADTADGVLSHVHGGSERRKAIMAAPEVGAFGVVTLVVVLAGRTAALATMEPDVLLVAGLWCGSRVAMALALAVVPYVGGGLGSAFGRGRAAAWGVVPAVLLCATAGVAGIAGLGGLALVSIGVVLLARRRLGGVTGDVLGAAGVLGETIGLVLATASW